MNKLIIIANELNDNTGLESPGPLQLSFCTQSYLQPATSTFPEFSIPYLSRVTPFTI